MLNTNIKWMDAIMYDNDDDKDDENGADDHDHDHNHEGHDDHDKTNMLIYAIKSRVCVRACVYIWCAIMWIQFTCI